MSLAYSRKDFLSDLILLIFVGALGAGAYRLLKPPLAKAWSRISHPALRGASPLAAGTLVEDLGAVRTLDDRAVPMSSLKGKVVFLNFWATWCGPCRMEMPSIEKLYRQYKDTDVVILCISEEDPLLLKAFAQKEKLEVPLYTVQKIPKFLNVTGLPTTFILSRSGKVALSHAGASQWNKKKIIRLLESLRASPA